MKPPIVAVRLVEGVHAQLPTLRPQRLVQFAHFQTRLHPDRAIANPQDLVERGHLHHRPALQRHCLAIIPRPAATQRSRVPRAAR